MTCIVIFKKCNRWTRGETLWVNTAWLKTPRTFGQSKTTDLFLDSFNYVTEMAPEFRKKFSKIIVGFPIMYRSLTVWIYSYSWSLAVRIYSYSWSLAVWIYSYSWSLAVCIYSYAWSLAVRIYSYSWSLAVCIYSYSWSLAVWIYSHSCGFIHTYPPLLYRFISAHVLLQYGFTDTCDFLP